MNIKRYIILSLASLITITMNAQQTINPTIEKKIDSLMSKMTLEEKVGQMNQYNGFWDAPPDGGRI